MGEERTCACPFCGLACDDLPVRVEGDRIALTPGICERAEGGFRRFTESLDPRVEGRRVTMEEALARAAEILAKARRPFYGGLEADIGGLKAVLRLAEKSGGIVDHGRSAASFAQYRALQIDGGFQTTLGEAANRADLFLFFGTTGVDVAPRLFEKWVHRRKKQFRDGADPLTLIFIGPEPPPTAARAPAGTKADIHHIDVARGDLAQTAALLRALWKNDRAMVGTRGKPWRKVLDSIRRADYGVLSWYGGHFPEDHGDLIVRMLSQWVQEINHERRFAALPLGGDGNGVGAAQVSTWQNGFPLRVAYGRGGVEHDSWRFRYDRDGADVRVWISCFGATPAPERPRIVLAASREGVGRHTEVFVPLAVPGIDHPGTVVRCDSSVSIPLAGLRSSDRWSLARVIAGIEARWPC